MPATHLSLYYHIIFSTKGRRSCIREIWERRFYEYLGGIIHGLQGVPIQIGGTSDHIHILVRLIATHSLSDVLRKIKSNSSKWIHSCIDERFCGWQEGYGAFTVSRRDIEEVRKYIRGQKEHHRKTLFKEEYINLLRTSGIEFDEKYLW